MALTDQLIAYWKLEEASGPRADSAGANTLSDVNTVGQAVGKIGMAAQFIAANSETLEIADNPAMSVGDIDFTFSAWFYIDSLGAGARGILSKDTGASREYGLYVDAAGNVSWNIFTPASASILVIFGVVAIQTWHHVMAWHDSTADVIRISINNAAPVSTANTAGVKDGTDPFRIGKQGGSNFFDGRIDEVGFWKRLLTAPEKVQLYNAGAGLTYPFGEGGAPLSSFKNAIRIGL